MMLYIMEVNAQISLQDSVHFNAHPQETSRNDMLIVAVLENVHADPTLPVIKAI